MLRITPSTQNDRALMFLKTVLNNTDNVTKIPDHGVLSAHAQGIAKIAGKAEKDIMLAMSILFPDNAYGDALDMCADFMGVSGRFGASGSSTYIRLVGDVGTTYLSSTHTFLSKDGIEFQLENDVTIGSFGFTYTKVRSTDVGLKTNIDAGSINNVSPKPIGHLYVVNEYKAMYGRDIESDNLFRKRIKDGPNELATHTIAMLEQVFMKINNNILRIFFQGLDDQSRIKIAIVTQNGINLSQSELDTILNQGNEFFGLSQYKPYGKQSYGVYLKNIDWQPIDISFRVELYPSYNVDNIRREIQIRISKYLDFRLWKPGEQKIEWDELLQIVKTTPGVKYVPDEYFYPNSDITTDKNKLPRLRGILMLNQLGQLISGLTNQFNPVYYPNNLDKAFTSTVLASI